MKVCSRCDQLLDEKDIFCPYCGQSADGATKALYKDNTLITVAKVFMYLGLASLIMGIVCLLFMLLTLGSVDSEIANIPEAHILVSAFVFVLFMIIIFLVINIILIKKLNKIIKNNEPMGVGYKIAVLLLSNLVSGIMLLLLDTE